MKNWKLLLVRATMVALSSLFVASAQPPPGCLQYSLPSPTPPLQCSAHLTSCHYVTTPTTLSLSATEQQLKRLLSQIEPGLTSGELGRECLDGFIFLYCLQSYGLCGQVDNGAFAPRRSVLCADDCVRVISEDCGVLEWVYLTNIVSQLRSAGILELPALTGLAGCNSTAGEEGTGLPCLTLAQANATELPEAACTTTPTPPGSPEATPNTTPLSTAAIAGICVVAGLTLLVAALLVATILCLARRQKQREKPPNSPHAGSAALGLGGEDVPDMQVKQEEAAGLRRGTLMLRASNIHEALLDVNPTPRTTTLSKRLKAGAFLKLSPKERLQQLEYPRGNICLVRDLWETNFGPVYVGEVSGLDQNNMLTSVFIKSLRNRASAKLRQQFRIEMTWASGFSHPNIISLLGVCVNEDPYYTLYEYLEYGSLKDFLQSVSSVWFDFDRFLGDHAEGESLGDPADGESFEEMPHQSMFGVEDLTGMACQVADGMDYLAKKAFVLKDLASRNCQVAHNLTIKIANFGLSYDRFSEDYCCIRSHKSMPVPLRWLAPETIRHSRVSVYSDIWSYGVLLWEIFSFGARPYSDLTNVGVVEAVLNGHVLSRPERCPQGVYSIMLKCWNAAPSKRPWFHTLGPELAEVPRAMNPEERKSLGGGPATPELARALRTL